MMVQDGGPAIESASMPRISEGEPVEVQMVAKLVAERAQECPEGRDFIPHGGSHPDPDRLRVRMIIAEKLARGIFPHPQWSRGEHAQGHLGVA